MKHINNRRNSEGLNGENFVRQIPETLKRGKIVKKKGHNDRLYIVGNKKEASIRSDWNKYNRNWLVSSYAQKEPTQTLPGGRTYGQAHVDKQQIPLSNLGKPNIIIPNSLEYFNPAVVPIVGNTIGDMNRNAGSGVLKGHVEKPEYPPDAVPLSFINTTDIQVQSTSEQNNHIFTMEEISQMPPDEIRRNLPEIERQTSLGLIQHQTQQVDYSGYTNPANGSNQIFSLEDIGSMTSDEYSQNEQAVQAQLNSIGIPTNNELQSAVQNNGGLIYVRPYTRSDGTQVRGYYRSK